jgi:hypothetical protein
MLQVVAIAQRVGTFLRLSSALVASCRLPPGASSNEPLHHPTFFACLIAVEALPLCHANGLKTHRRQARPVSCLKK